MPSIIGIFCALPFLAGPVGRAGVWESDQSPLTQLLFVPGLPALFALLGLLAGWRLWKRLWGPRVVKDKGAR